MPTESPIDPQPASEACQHILGMQYDYADGWEPVHDAANFERIWSRKSKWFNFCPLCGLRLLPEHPEKPSHEPAEGRLSPEMGQDSTQG